MASCITDTSNNTNVSNSQVSNICPDSAKKFFLVIIALLILNFIAILYK